jgi:hypothetical protein
VELFDLLLSLINLALENLVCLHQHLAEILQQDLLFVIDLALLIELLRHSPVELVAAHSIEGDVELITGVVGVGGETLLLEGSHDIDEGWGELHTH